MMKTTITVATFLLLLLNGCKINNTVSQLQPIGEYQSSFKGKTIELKLKEDGGFYFKKREGMESSTRTEGIWYCKNDTLFLHSIKCSRRNLTYIILNGGAIAFENAPFKIKNNTLQNLNGELDFFKKPVRKDKLLYGNGYH